LVLSIGGVKSNTVTIAIAGVPANKLAGGDLHTCAVTGTGAVLCWGSNRYGQLGNGTTTNSSTPVPVSGLSGGVASITAGKDFTCALMRAGTVMCWGYNFDGELGNGATTDSHVPVPVMNAARNGALSGVAAIASGQYHTCAVTRTGTVLCWGLNDEGDLGQEPSLPNSTVPVPVTDIPAGIIAITAGGGYTCALTSAGGAWCWGISGFGQLGVGTKFPNAGTAAAVLNTAGNAPLGGVSSIAAGYEDACAVLTDSSLVCWGANGSGEVGNNTNSQADIPVPVLDTAGTSPLTGIAAVTGGDDDTCALTTGGGVLCWGSSSNGQNGTGPKGSTDTFTAQQVVGLTSGVIEIGSGYRHNCAITSSGGVMCWGFNITGQLGNGNTNDSRTPVAVVGVGGKGLLQLF
jgi:alpha-tubulin suppressor-like RCC1 family protein